MRRAILLLFYVIVASPPAKAQTVVDNSDSSCIYIGHVVGLDPYGDNFLSVRRRPNGPAGLSEEVDRLFTNDRVCIISIDGHWLNVKYEHHGRMYSGWSFDKYIASETSQDDTASMSCDELWYARNKIFAREGYCFNTDRARGVFGRGCFPPYGHLSDSERDRVQQLQMWERRKGC